MLFPAVDIINDQVVIIMDQVDIIIQLQNTISKLAKGEISIF